MAARLDKRESVVMAGRTPIDWDDPCGRGAERYTEEG
jgi:hypothetical protein